MQVRTSGTSVAGTLTDANGNYKFSNMRSGSYTITPSMGSQEINLDVVTK